MLCPIGQSNEKPPLQALAKWREYVTTDFCRIKSKDCRAMLERHGLDTAKLWTSKVPEPFSFIENNSHQIKANYE